MAVMIWRGMHSSAKARNVEASVGLKSRTALYRPNMPPWPRASWAAPPRKYERAFARAKPRYLLSRSFSAHSSPALAAATSRSSSSSTRGATWAWRDLMERTGFVLRWECDLGHIADIGF